MSCDLQANEITGCTHNVPRRLSRQCVVVPGDSKLINMQAGGNTCPAELPDDPSPLCARLWRCGQSRNSVSVQSMPNNMQAGGNTCPAGPLDDAASLPNSPRRCGRQCIPNSFFLSSLNVPRRCGRLRNPDSCSLPRICPDVPIGGVFLLLHPYPVIPIALILYHSIKHPTHRIHPMLSVAACRFFPPAPRALLFR